jgi:hypothetical protein
MPQFASVRNTYSTVLYHYCNTRWMEGWKYIIYKYIFSASHIIVQYCIVRGIIYQTISNYYNIITSTHLYRIVSYRTRIVSYHILSYLIMLSYRMLSYRIVWYRIVSYPRFFSFFVDPKMLEG